LKRESKKKPTVLIFKETLLPVSETFIAAQVGRLKNFIPQYVGLGLVSPSLALPSDVVLLTKEISRTSEFRQKLYRRTGIAPAFHSCAARTGAQLIHAHFASGGRTALPLARHLKVPLIVTLHGSDVTINVNFRKRYADLWREVSTFLCVSEFIKKEAVKAGFPEEKMLKHFIGVDREVFRPAHTERDPNLIVFVGRLVEKKGCRYMLEAMAQVQKQHSKVRTVVIGDGPLRDSLEELARRLNVSCEFLGSQPPPVVREWMSRARIFCAPSITAADGDSEGLGMVFAEAQGMGTPVVSFRHGGIPEVVLHEETGLLAEERNATDLATQLSRLMEDHALWSRLSERSVVVVRERFDLEQQTFKLEELYSQACGLALETNPEKLGVNKLSAMSSFR
jgi:colanic acid/amylovoran biosynthesis glycosyltransferase